MLFSLLPMLAPAQEPVAQEQTQFPQQMSAGRLLDACASSSMTRAGCGVQGVFSRHHRRIVLKLEIDPQLPLLWAIRDSVGSTGTKYGCGMGLCGACTVQLDGEAVRACVTPAVEAEGKQITTIEGLDSRVASAAQAAWENRDVVQCGYCQSGQIMPAVALLTANPQPYEQDIDAAMSGNMCRCRTYVRIRATIQDAARALA